MPFRRSLVATAKYWLTAIWLCIAGVSAAELTAGSTAEPGQYVVESALVDWHDQTRNRDIPAKIYFPQHGASLPVIVFSHGLGGSRDGYEYLGRHWASWGYVSVHLQHQGSDSAVWKGQSQPMQAMRQALKNPHTAVQRPADVSFAIDQLEELARRQDQLGSRLDLDRIGVAGHSFGAWTVLAVVGQVFVLPNGRELTLSDPRVKAAMPLSAPVPRNRNDLDKTFGSIAVPCMHMTGTMDNSPIGETTAEERRVPFDHIRRADQYLLIFSGGDHMIFSGRDRWQGNSGKDADFQALIRLASTAFWDAYLKNDAHAKAFLTAGELKKLLGKDGTLEVFLANPK